jgi:hypothetical protein
MDGMTVTEKLTPVNYLQNRRARWLRSVSDRHSRHHALEVEGVQMSVEGKDLSEMFNASFPGRVG